MAEYKMKCLMCVLLFFTVAFSTRRKQLMKHSLKIDNIKDCGTRTDFLEYNYTSKSLGYGVEVYDFYSVYKKRIEKTKMGLTIWICYTRSVADCEYYGTFNVDDYCQFMEANGFWTPLIDGTEPEFHCPIEGAYKKINASLDGEKLYSYVKMIASTLVDSIEYWIGRATWTDKVRNVEFLCVEVQGGGFVTYTARKRKKTDDQDTQE